MNNQNVKRGRGRPPMYSTEEERRDAIRRSKSKYMLNKEWYCETSKTGRNYSMAGKHSHLKTLKHQKNTNAINMERIKAITQRLNP